MKNTSNFHQVVTSCGNVFRAYVTTQGRDYQLELDLGKTVLQIIEADDDHNSRADYCDIKKNTDGELCAEWSGGEGVTNDWTDRDWAGIDLLVRNTPDDENDAIRAQVEREFPRPTGGFESSDQEDEWRERCEARFIELVQAAGEVKAHVHLRVSPTQKSRWVRAARPGGLSAWAIAALDKAAREREIETSSLIGNMRVTSTASFIVYGSVSGLIAEVGTLQAAVNALAKHRRGCEKQGGYSDARVYEPVNGKWSQIDASNEPA